MTFSATFTACIARPAVARTCERGVKGCDIQHDKDYSITKLFDKLAAAGVEIIVNGRQA